MGAVHERKLKGSNDRLIFEDEVQYLEIVCLVSYDVEATIAVWALLLGATSSKAPSKD